MTNPPKKTKKPKGPIRVEAVGPFLIIAALVIVYFTFFFDNHVRRGLEWAGSQANGAEVNVDAVDVSFRDAAIRIGRVQVTDPSRPELNRFELGEFRLDFLWDALLRAKLVTEDAALLGIAAQTKRSRPGRVLPPSETEEASWFKDKVTAEFHKRFEEAGLAKVVDLLKGFDPSKEVDKLGGELESVKKLDALQTDLDAKQKEWQQMLSEVPGQKEFESLQAQIDSLQSTGIKNPAQAKAQLDKAQGLLKQSKSAINDVQKKSSGLQSDLAEFQGRIGESAEWVAADRRALQSKLKLPDLDTESITGQLFAAPAIDQVSQVRSKVDLARKYMPEKKSKPVDPPARSAGRIFRFPVTTSYPMFWLKRAAISSKAGASEYSGNIEGELTDVTTDPHLVGRPAILKLAGDFPHQSISGVSLSITADHRAEPARDAFAVKVGSFPSGAKNFLESEDLVFGLLQGVGSAELSGELVGDVMKLSARQTFLKPEFNIEGGSDVLVGLVRDTANSLKDLWFQLEAHGPLDGLKFGLDSNIGAALAGTLSRQLDAQVKRARELIDKRVEQEVGAQRKAVEDEFNAQKRSITHEIESRKAQAEALQAKVERKIAQIQKQATGGAAEKLKKKLPF